VPDPPCCLSSWSSFWSCGSTAPRPDHERDAGHTAASVEYERAPPPTRVMRESSA
jgi:hypothetical protein